MKRAIIAMLAAMPALSCLADVGDSHSGELTFSTVVESPEAASVPAGKVLSIGERFRQGSLPAEALEAPPVRMAPGRAWQLSDLTGSRQLMTNVYSTHVCYGGDASVEAVGSDSVRINRFCFGDVSIMAHVDLSTGLVTIPTQFIAEVSGSPVYLCKMNFRKQVYDKTASMRGHLYKGSIVIDDGFGFFVTSGAQEGAYLTVGLMEYAAVATPNATITANRITFSGSPSTTANRVVTPQTSNGFAYPATATKLRLMRLPVTTSYSNINLNLGVDGSVEIDPQPISNMTLYGDFYIYKLTEKVDAQQQVTFSVSPLSPVEGIYTTGDKKLTWDSWGVARTNALMGMYESTTVAFTDAIEFPSASSMTLEGEGTQSSPWLIKTAEDMAALRSDILTNTQYRGARTAQPNDADQSYYPVYAGKYFKLAADIDFGADSPAVEPIGNDTYWFAGSFDGDGHTLTNLAIENYAYDYCGLFSRLAPGSQFKNVKFKDAYVSTLGYTAGVIAGRSYAPIADVEITDSRVLATAGYNCGMAVGYNHSPLQNISVTGAYLQGLGYLGGIAGRSYTGMTNCHVQGTVIQTGKQVFSGGLVGHQTKVSVNDPAPVVSGCSFTGSMQATGDEIGIGGIAGGLSYSRLENSYANAVVVNPSNISAYVGGLVGTSFSSVIDNCYATGFVRNANSTYVGGLVGHNTKSTSAGPTTVSNSYFSGMLLTASTDDTRGITGDKNDFTITNCYFDNQIAVCPDALYGVPTATLTSGTLPTGFSADIWSATAGQYPTLKVSAANDASTVSAAAVSLPDGQNVNDVQNNFSYAPVSPLTWRAFRNGSLNTEGGYAFTFDNGTARINYEQFTDTIYASKGVYSKYWFVNVAPVMFSGSGTQEDPWMISTVADLKKFSDISNNASMTFTGRYFALANDIDCQGDTLIPVCKDHSAKLTFEGSFDGRGHSIDNFRIEAVGFFTADNVTGTAVPGQVNPKDALSYYYAGLFGNVGKQGVVRNLTIGSRAYVQAFQYAGVIAGGSEGLIENCRNLATLRCYYSYAGGMVGYLKAGGMVRNCYNGGDIFVNANTAGGIVGQAQDAFIENCENTGYISAYWFNPYQKEASQYGAGGIVGYLNSSQITNVVNSGKVESYKQVGGIVSKVNATAAKPAKVTAAVNHGLVYSSVEQTSVGAIAGLNTLGTFENCLIDKQIQKVGPVSGGLNDGVMMLPTLTLVSAQGYPKQYLPDSVWNLTSGQYPTMKYTGTQPAQSVLNAKAVISFPANDYAQAMMSNAPLAAGVEWSLVNKAVFSIDGSTLKVMVPMAGCFTDTIVASLNGCTYKLPLASLNPVLTDGEGTMSKPFLISEPTEYLSVARFMKQFDFDYAGYYFKVTADLDFAGLDFVPMGADGVMFNGSFDGDGHKMKNVSYTADASDKTAVGRGFFGTLGYDGFISSLTLESGTITGYQNVGGIVGVCYGNLLDCHNKAAVQTLGTTGAGGIAGYAYPGSIVMMCTNVGTITAKTNYAGGIVGAAPASAEITVDECTNSGAINGTSKIGGVVGSGSAHLTGCSNSGAVKTTATGTYAGGVIGEALLPSSVKKCSNTGLVFANQYCAGVVGTSIAHTEANPFVISDCYNTADLTAGAKGYMGGVAGTIKAGAQIIRCYNTGHMNGKASNNLRIAGVVSDLASSKAGPALVQDCFNKGLIEAWSNSGGVVGANSGDSLKIVNCYNTADVVGYFTTATNVGGILGNGPAEFQNCWNSGNITAKGKQAGGINGTNTAKCLPMIHCVNVGNVEAATSDAGGMIGLGRATMVDCYNQGNITAPTAAGGLFGEPGAAASSAYTIVVYDCYNAGKVTASSNWGNIMGQNTSCKFLNIERVYGCTDSTAISSYDQTLNVTGLTTRQLMEKQISAAFRNIAYTFPTLNVFANCDTLNFYAAAAVPAAGESLGNVLTKVYLGLPAGAEWTSSTDVLRINGDHATNKSLEANVPATLTLTLGGLTRVYNVVLAKTTGVDGIDGDGKAVRGMEYYRLDGTRTDADDRAPVLIRRTVYLDGTFKVEKIIKR